MSPLQQDAVHRNLLAWAHAQSIANGHRVECHVLLRAVVTKSSRRLRGEMEER